MTYATPTDLADALHIAADHDVRVVAGGTDLYPAMQQGQRPPALLDVTRIAGFTGISATKAGYRIGAATRWSQIVSADLPPAFDGLKQAARDVGSVQIQNAGTVAGNLCNASPAADGVPPLLTLDASVELASAARDTRLLPLGKFLKDVRQTALEADELVTAIVIPEPPIGARSAFEKLGSRRYLVISISMVSVLVCLDADGRISAARVAVGACSAVAQRLPGLEADLVGQAVQDAAVSAAHLAGLEPISDVRGSRDYRLDVVAEQIVRAIRRATDE